MNTSKANKIDAKIRYITDERTFTNMEMMALIAKNPERVTRLAKHNLSIDANPVFFDLVNRSPLGQFLNDEGEVTTSGLTGL